MMENETMNPLNVSLLGHIYSKNDKYEKLWEKLAPFTHKAQNGLTQRKNEIIELWQLFERINPHVIVEVGVAQGGTFAGWCQLASDDALIIGIDRDCNDCLPRMGEQVHPDIADVHEKMTEEGGGMYALKRRNSHQKIVAINGWTNEYKTLLSLLNTLQGRHIDFLFHDASHQAEMAKKDFEIFWPLIAEGGVYAIHDIGFYSVGEVTKWKWWREIRDNGPQSATYSYSYPDRYDLSMGIGVLFK